MEKQPRKYSRIVWIVAAAVIIAGILFAGNRLRQRRAQASTPQTGDTVTAFIGDLSSSASASGKLEAQRQATLSLAFSGRVEAVFVQEGDQVEAGDPLVQLESDGLARNVATAEQNLAIQAANLAELKAPASQADIAAAQAAVASAQAQLDDLKEGPSPEEVAASEANVRAAQANINNASGQLGQIAAGPGQAEVAAAQASLAQAQLNYDSAKEAHDRTLQCFTDPNGKEVCPLLGPPEEQARSNLSVAEESLKAAQAQYDALAAGADHNAVASGQASVAAAVAQRDAAQAQLEALLAGASQAQLAAAEAQLAQAQASLETLLAGPSAERVAIAEAQVAQARISLEEAQANLEKATLAAPFAGIVTAVHVRQGEFASGPAIELVDPASLMVVLDVDEVDIGELALGQPAVVTLEAWPSEEIDSTVAAIAPSANAGSGGDNAIVSYQVRLSLSQTELPLRVGMTANARLITSSRQGVLLVPNRAITADRDAGTFSVTLLKEGQVSTVNVTVGLRDDQYTQITGGLSEGDQLLIGDFAAPLRQFGPGSENGNGGGPFGRGGNG